MDPATVTPREVGQTVDMASGPALPTGTVTFLLTDVEASTRLWNERTGEMPDAIARHYAILDGVVTRHGGVRPVEQGEGDSVVAAFAHAPAAVAAALDAQIELTAALPWLAVRVAVHTGEAILRDEGNYVGLGIIRCARLRACGHGGQVLVSATTAPLVDGALPSGASLVGLGTVRLRDIGGREQVYQLAHPDVRATFPPLRAIEAVTHNLPNPLTTLIGRGTEREEVLELVRTERLVTLTGSGGAGKTRLAIDVAHVLVDDLSGGCWWIELGPLTAEHQPVERLARVLGVELPANQSPEPAIVGQLRAMGPALLVFDNAEHLLGPVAALAETVLSQCTDVHALVTTREPLGIQGEVVWRVPSLRCAPDGTVAGALAAFDGNALFVDRARRARPNLVLDDRGAAHAVTICRRCDGLPLAIELAAARCRTLSLERIAEGLDDAFSLLTGGARNALPRQQTLLASIAWSVDLLDEVESTVFRRLAVFQGSFTLDAAEAVAADGDLIEDYVVFDVLTRLVDKSLVTFEDPGRYRLLETVRQYALDRLRDSRDLAATRDRHAAWMAVWCRQATHGERGLRLYPFAADAPDVVAALEWSYGRDKRTVYRITAGFSALLQLLGNRAVHRLLDWHLAQDPDEHPAEWAAGMAGCCDRVLHTDRYDIAERIDDIVARLDPADADAMFSVRGLVHLRDTFTGDGSLAREYIAHAERTDNTIGRIHGAGSLAFVVGRMGLVAEAEELVASATALLDEHQLPWSADTLAFGYCALLNLPMYRGDLERARALVKHEPGEPEALHAAALEHAYLGFLVGDDALLDGAQRWTQTDGGLREAPLRSMIGALAAWATGDTARAADLLGPAISAIRLTGVLMGTYPVLNVAAQLAAGRTEIAATAADGWRSTTGELGDRPLHLAGAHHALALVAAAQGRLDVATDHAHAALAVAHEHGLGLLVMDALTLLADVADRRQAGPVAARLAAAAHTARRQAGYLRPLLPEPGAADALAAQLRDEHPDAYAEGAALSLDDAVAYARRSRGQRGRPVAGWSSLTPTERRVADLVAAGRANPEIARQLFMSVATVKTHLTRVYAKLGVRNRTELATSHPDR